MFAESTEQGHNNVLALASLILEKNDVTEERKKLGELWYKMAKGQIDVLESASFDEMFAVLKNQSARKAFSGVVSKSASAIKSMKGKRKFFW